MMTFIMVLAVVAMISKAAGILVVSYLLFRAFGWVHQWSPRLAWSLAAAAVLVAGMVALGTNWLERANSSRRAETTADVQQQRRAADSQIREEMALAAEAERKYRAGLIERWRVARKAAIEQWRKELIDDRAVGAPGEVPPMLQIEDTGKLVALTNQGEAPACVLITRVATRDSAVMSRCSVGGNRCVLVRPGSSVRWPTLRAGNSESCLAGSLEYRVGSVDYPEPSWWSETALNQFGSEDPNPEFVDTWTNAALMTEIVRLEKQIEERMRVER